MAELNTFLFFQIFNLNHKFPLLDGFMVFGAEYLIYLIFAASLLIGLLGQTKNKKPLSLMILAIPVAAILIETIHLFIQQPRPFLTFPISPLVSRPDSFSFPSGHTTWASLPALSMLFYNLRLGTILIFLMLWVGISRIFVGVHYPLDILGGIATGLIAVSIAWVIKKYYSTFFEILKASLRLIRKLRFGD